MKQIRFLVDWKTKKKGELVNYSDDACENFISLGMAEYADEPKQQKTDTKKENHAEWLTQKASEPMTVTCSGCYHVYSAIYNDYKEAIQADQETHCPGHCEYQNFHNDVSLAYEKYVWGAKQLEKHGKEPKPKKRCIVLPIDHYIDNSELLYQQQPYFYDKQTIFWFWNESLFMYEQKDETDIMNMYDDILGFKGQTVSSKVKQQTLEAMKRVGRKKQPLEAPVRWLQFKDKAFSLRSKKLHKVQPNYFFTNPLPWEIGETSDTPTIDKLFKEWVGDDYAESLYEMVAYACYRDYPIQLIFCLNGHGRNGKSQFLKMLLKFLGKENVCSTELDQLIESRFETFKLYKKLLCSMGETNFGVLRKTSLLKKLVGGDYIGYEIKNKQPFDDVNYAKIVIASNSLPSSDDDSDGFMRRWHIIEFPNEFPEGKDIIQTIPDQEYRNLARKVTEILPGLLERGTFTCQGEIQERRHKYLMASNPFPIFLENCCDKGDDKFVTSSELYTAYVQFLRENKRRKVTKGEYKSAVENEGFLVEKTSIKVKELTEDDNGWKNAYWVKGVTLKENWKDLGHLGHFDVVSNSLSRAGKVSGKTIGNVPNVPKINEKDNSVIDIHITPIMIESVKVAIEVKTGKTDKKGALIEDVQSHFAFPIDAILDILKLKGEAYEPSPGRIALL